MIAVLAAAIILPGAKAHAFSLDSVLPAPTAHKMTQVAIEQGWVKLEPKPKPIPVPVPAPVVTTVVVEPPPPPPPPPPIWQIPVVDSGAGSVAYPLGQCTYLVSLRRSVTWYGNAGQWWWTSPLEHSQIPRVGAIYVGWDNSYYGHVAYVTAVYDENTWTQEEMNVVGWNVISYRTVNRWQVPLQGFLW